MFLKIRFPLHGQELFFGIVAAFAASNHIAARAFSAARNRHDMIHGQLTGRRFTFAIIALAFGNPALPPLGFPQVPGLAAFAFQI